MRRGTCPSAGGGGGLAVWLPSSPYLPCGRTPGGPPVGACTARAPFGPGRLVRPAPSLLCLPTLPLCPRGGDPRSATVIPLPRGGGGVWGGGGGRPCRLPFVARMSQARRKHDASTGRGTWLQWGAGFSPLGPPYPRGRVPHQRRLRAHVAPASPRSSRYCSVPPRFLPLARWFASFFVFFFLCVSTARRPSLPLARRSVLCPPPPHVPSLSPRCPRPFRGWVGEKGVRGGGASSLCVLWRKHIASTAQARGAALVPLQGGVGGVPCGSRRRPSYPVFAPPAPPLLGLARRVLLTGTVVWSVPHPLSATPPPCRFVLGGGGAVRPSLPSSPTLGGPEVCVCGGGGACRLPFVARMSQARRKHGAGTRRGTFPSAGGGGGHALWLPSSPFLPCVRTPDGPPVGACTARALYGHGRVVRPAPSRRCLPTLPLCPRGGGRVSPPLPASPTLGGAGVCGGGGGGRPCRLPFVARTSQARRKHGASTRRGTCPSAGGGLGLPCVTRRRPSYPACAPPGGRRCVGGGGAPLSSSLRCTHVAGTTQARRKHGVRHLAAAGGGGFLLWAFPPFSMV